MDLRLALHELAARHDFDTTRVKRLRQLAGIDAEPASLSIWLPRGVAILGAALGGFGVILWIAANWEDLGRFGRFALLEALVAAACVGAWTSPRARAPLGLIAFLGIGGLFAYFGQTYQSGADPWQLFALWAALALPLCLGVRSDVVWTPWALVAMTAISLWVYAHLGHRLSVRAQDLSVHLIGWSAALLLVAALSAATRRITGAGDWSMRLAITLTVAMFTTTALGGLFGEASAHFALSLALLGVGAGMLSSRQFHDLFGLSAIALGLNILLIAGLARVMFDSHASSFIAPLFVLGLAAAGLLAATVTWVLRVSRRHASEVSA